MTRVGPVLLCAIFPVLAGGCGPAPACSDDSPPNLCFTSPSMEYVDATVAENPEIMCLFRFETDDFEFRLFVDYSNERLGELLRAGWDLDGPHASSSLLATSREGAEHHLQGTGGWFRVREVEEGSGLLELDAWHLTFDERHDAYTDGNLRAFIGRVREETPLVSAGD